MKEKIKIETLKRKNAICFFLVAFVLVLLVATLGGCKPKTPFKVIYDLNFDGKVDVQNYEDASKLNLYIPVSGINKGYRFDGWFLNGKKFDENATVSSDITLVAKWQKVWNVEIVIDAFRNQTIEVDDNAKIDIQKLTFEKLNYSLSGFYKKNVDETTTCFDLNSQIVHDEKIFADWCSESMTFAFYNASNELVSSDNATYATVESFSQGTNLVIIPEFAKGLPVKKIGIFKTENGVSELDGIGTFDGKSIAVVQMNSKIDEIGAMAFMNSTIQKIQFSSQSSLKTIGKLAFANCHQLEEIVLPCGLEKIGSQAFQVTDAQPSLLKKVFIPKSVVEIGNYVFARLNVDDNLKIFVEHYSTSNVLESFSTTWNRKNSDMSSGFFETTFFAKSVNLDFGGGLVAGETSAKKVVIGSFYKGTQCLFIPTLQGKTFVGYFLNDVQVTNEFGCIIENQKDKFENGVVDLVAKFR